MDLDLSFETYNQEVKHLVDCPLPSVKTPSFDEWKKEQIELNRLREESEKREPAIDWNPARSHAGQYRGGVLSAMDEMDMMSMDAGYKRHKRDQFDTDNRLDAAPVSNVAVPPKKDAVPAGKYSRKEAFRFTVAILAISLIAAPVLYHFASTSESTLVIGFVILTILVLYYALLQSFNWWDHSVETVEEDKAKKPKREAAKEKNSTLAKNGNAGLGYALTLVTVIAFGSYEAYMSLTVAPSNPALYVVLGLVGLVSFAKLMVPNFAIVHRLWVIRFNWQNVYSVMGRIITSFVFFGVSIAGILAFIRFELTLSEGSRVGLMIFSLSLILLSYRMFWVDYVAPYIQPGRKRKEQEELEVQEEVLYDYGQESELLKVLGMLFPWVLSIGVSGLVIWATGFAQLNSVVVDHPVTREEMVEQAPFWYADAECMVNLVSPMLGSDTPEAVALQEDFKNVSLVKENSQKWSVELYNLSRALYRKAFDLYADQAGDTLGEGPYDGPCSQATWEYLVKDR